MCSLPLLCCAFPFCRHNHRLQVHTQFNLPRTRFEVWTQVSLLVGTRLFTSLLTFYNTSSILLFRPAAVSRSTIWYCWLLKGHCCNKIMSTTNTTGGGFGSTVKFVPYQDVSHWQDWRTCIVYASMMIHMSMSVSKLKRQVIAHNALRHYSVPSLLQAASLLCLLHYR